MVKHLTIASFLVVLLHMSFDSRAAGPQKTAEVDPGPQPTRHFQARMDRVLEHRIAAVKSRYVAGERVIVYRFLTNLSNEPLEICETCLAESVRVVTTMQHPDPICGWFGDHSPGFRPKLGTLAPGATREDQVDVTDMRCAFNTYGPGKYKVVSSYCYDGPDRQHGLDPPLYCVDADERLLEFAAK